MNAGRYCLFAALLCFADSFGSGSAAAQTLERIEKNAVFRVGTRIDAAPFASRAQDGRYQGFSVDLLHEIRRRLEHKLGFELEMVVTPVTPANRIELIEAGALDIVCEIATPTWDRERRVDFTVPFFRDGTRILMFRNNVKTDGDLSGSVIAVAAGTTTESIIAGANPAIALRAFPSMEEAFSAFFQGEVDGVANIGIVLLRMVRERAGKRSMVLLPRTQAYGNEAMSCILPQNDSTWRDFTNSVIIELFDGLSEYQGRYMELYDRHFGLDALLNYPLSRANRDYLLSSDIWAQ